MIDLKNYPSKFTRVVYSKQPYENCDFNTKSYDSVMNSIIFLVNYLKNTYANTCDDLVFYRERMMKNTFKVNTALKVFSRLLEVPVESMIVNLENKYPENYDIIRIIRIFKDSRELGIPDDLTHEFMEEVFNTDFSNYMMSR